MAFFISPFIQNRSFSGLRGTPYFPNLPGSGQAESFLASPPFTKFPPPSHEGGFSVVLLWCSEGSTFLSVSTIPGAASGFTCTFFPTFSPHIAFSNLIFPLSPLGFVGRRGLIAPSP